MVLQMAYVKRFKTPPSQFNFWTQGTKKPRTSNTDEGPYCHESAMAALAITNHTHSRSLENPTARSASQELTQFSRNTGFTSLQLVPLLSQQNPIHIHPPYFPKIQFNIILQSTHRSSWWSFPLLAF